MGPSTPGSGRRPAAKRSARRGRPHGDGDGPASRTALADGGPDEAQGKGGKPRPRGGSKGNRSPPHPPGPDWGKTNHINIHLFLTVSNMLGHFRDVSSVIFRASPGPGVARNGFSAKNDSQFKGRHSNPCPGDPFRGHFSFLKVTPPKMAKVYGYVFVLPHKILGIPVSFWMFFFIWSLHHLPRPWCHFQKRKMATRRVPRARILGVDP